MTSRKFNALVDQTADRLYRFALSLVGSEADAQDAVQDAFERLWARRDKVQSSKASSYLFTTVHNACMDHFRKMRRVSDAAIPEIKAPADPAQYAPDLNDILHEALDTLPAVQRSVLLLRDYEGYSYADIAQTCQLSLAQVKSYIHRGRRAMQAQLGSIENVV
jgi:RNA polymerase sigma-70 factor (ECF subfamily)